jgi:DNA-binding transcriptional regulator YiaG
MPKGGYHVLTKVDLRDRIKEIEERIKQMDRREKALGDLKKWLANRKLSPTDLLWMLRQMRPKRADAPVKSKRPLKPTSGRFADRSVIHGGKEIERKGDPAFREAIRKARIDAGLVYEDLAKKCGVSGATIHNWEQGRYVPKNAARIKILKVLELPPDLGEAASLEMEKTFGGGKHVRNGTGALL